MFIKLNIKCHIIKLYSSVSYFVHFNINLTIPLNFIRHQKKRKCCAEMPAVPSHPIIRWWIH